MTATPLGGGGGETALSICCFSPHCKVHLTTGGEVRGTRGGPYWLVSARLSVELYFFIYLLVSAPEIEDYLYGGEGGRGGKGCKLRTCRHVVVKINQKERYDRVESSPRLVSHND